MCGLMSALRVQEKYFLSERFFPDQSSELNPCTKCGRNLSQCLAAENRKFNGGCLRIARRLPTARRPKLRRFSPCRMDRTDQSDLGAKRDPHAGVGQNRQDSQE